MKIKIVDPIPETLLEAMRAIGYSLETSFADVIDNSITAKATSIKISFQDSRLGKPYIAILDDGVGMNEKMLEEAMRHGSSHASIKRDAKDLGRFGLGLKTASQSQSRVLTVITIEKATGLVAAARWDLDFLKIQETWSLQILEKQDLGAEEFELPQKEIEELFLKKHGTLIIWQKLDRLIATLKNDKNDLAQRIMTTSHHLGLVFHRFICAQLEIKINGVKIESIDPFLEKQKVMPWELGEETIKVNYDSINNCEVTIKAYILPSLSRLSEADLSSLSGQEGLRKGQGFYIYRANRLVVWGTWFKLVKQEELSKLARIKVDIPNSMDHLWSLDIKKSTAYPPEIIKERLKSVITKITEKSKRVITYNGRPTIEINSLWTHIHCNEQSFRFEVNRKHPILDALKQKLSDNDAGKLEAYLISLEAAMPYSSIYSMMAADKKSNLKNDRSVSDILIILAEDLIRNFKSQGLTDLEALMKILEMEPFSILEDARKFIEDKINVIKS